MASKNFFFSYARVDKDWATRISSDLLAGGVDLWIDHINIRKGKNYDTEIENAINEAKCILVLLSLNSVVSDNVRNEITLALEEGKEVIPLLIENCKPPLSLRRRQRVDFTGDYDKAINELLNALGFQIRNVSGAIAQTLSEQNLKEENKIEASIESIVFKKSHDEKLILEEHASAGEAEVRRNAHKFEFDIFVSYASFDDVSLTQEKAGWVTDFRGILEVRLGQILGFRPKIWRDSNLQGTDFFPQTLEHFRNFKIMIPIISPHYLKSEWCKTQVELFCKAASQTGGIVIDNRARIFPIIKTPVKLSDQPVELQTIPGYHFYGSDVKTGRIREFRKESGGDLEVTYYQLVYDIASDIAHMLSLFQNKS